MFESAPLAVPVYTPNVATFLPNTAGIYADFTTEGSTYPLYYLNGTSYASFAAWLTAISGTFTRASTAYRTNASGNLESVGSGVIRFDYDPLGLFSKGLLLEGSSTNLALQSNTFSNASWNGGTTVSVAQNVTGPDGVANSAWTITDTAANVQHGLFQNPAESASTPYTHSLYVKYTNHQYIFTRNEGNYATYDLINGIVTNVQTGSTNDTATITPVGNGWFRITHSWTTTTGGVNPIFFGLANSSAYAGATYAGSGSDTFLAWGFQMEAQSFASSYIPTTTATVTRAADSLTATPISSWYNLNNGTLYVQSDTTAGDTQRGPASIFNSGNSANRIDLRTTAATGANQLALVQTTAGGGSQFIPVGTDTGQYNYTAGVSSRAAISVAAGNVNYVKDAGAADSSSALALMPVTPDTLNIGDLEASGIRQPFGHVSQIGYWPNTATAAQLQGLTSPPGWVPTAIAGANPTLYADFAFGGYWYNGWSYSLAAWEASLGATFSRSSIAYRTNGSGLLESVSSNVLRFDFDPVTLASKGVLLEGASTNLALQSNTFTAAAWFPTRTTVTANTTTSPDGTSNASTLTTLNGTNSQWLQQTISVTSGTTYTFSIYAKDNGQRYLQVVLTNADFGAGNLANFDLVAGVVGTVSGGSATITPVGNGWFRITRTIAAAATDASCTLFLAFASSTTDAQLPSITTNGVNGAFLFGAQLEALPFASSYIATTSGTVTRAADTLLAQWYGVDFPGTMFAQWQTARDDSTGSDGPGLQRENDSANLLFMRLSSNGQQAFNVGAGVIGVNGSVSDPGANTFHKNAYTWNTADYAESADGAAPATSTTAGAPASNLQQIAFMTLHFNGVGAFETIAKFGLWNNLRATNAQLQTLTT